MSAPVVNGNNEDTGHIISTTIGGKNGEPKQVYDTTSNIPNVLFEVFINAKK